MSYNRSPMAFGGRLWDISASILLIAFLSACVSTSPSHERAKTAPKRTTTGAAENPDRVASAAAPSVERKAYLDGLQRQIKELSDSNQELRTKIRELTDQLAETKQLLADNMLELNRLKHKPGSSKGKSQA